MGPVYLLVTAQLLQYYDQIGYHHPTDFSYLCVPLECLKSPWLPPWVFKILHGSPWDCCTDLEHISAQLGNHKIYILSTANSHNIEKKCSITTSPQKCLGCLLWDTKGQKQIRTARQDSPSNFHQPLRARNKPLSQGLQCMEEPSILQT